MVRSVSRESGLPKASRRLDRARPPWPFDLSDSKIHPPVGRPGIVSRTALLDRMKRAGEKRLILLVAPAGYGKTTLLSQWGLSKGVRVAWLSADHDNDPAVFLTYLTATLDAVEAIDPAVLRALTAPGTPGTVLPLLVSVLQSIRNPIFLILDHTGGDRRPANALTPWSS